MKYSRWSWSSATPADVDQRLDAFEAAGVSPHERRPGDRKTQPIAGNEGDVGAVTILQGQEGLAERGVDQDATQRADGAGQTDQRPGTPDRNRIGLG